MRETASGGRRGTHPLNILCGSIAGIFFKYLAEILWIIAESHRPGNSFDIVIMIVHHKADGLFHPLFVQVIGKPDAFLLYKLFAQVADTDKEIVLCQPF